MGSIRVRADSQFLMLDFRYKNTRCRELTNLKDTKANRKKLEQALKIIEGEIAQGTFEYERFFPNSPKVDFFRKLEQEEQSKFRKTPLFSEFAESWYGDYEHTWRHATATTYRSYIDKRLTPAFGKLEISQITKADLLKVRSSIAKSSNGTLKPKTINKYFRCMAMIMSEAADRFDFTSPFVNFKALKEQKVHIQPFSIEEVNSILSTVRADWRCYVLVRFFTGMRTGEINGLKWEYVDFKNRQILIRETFSDGRWEYTKNDGSQREIEMTSLVYDALESHYEQRKSETLVFPLLNDKPIRTNNFIRRIWEPLLSYLNIDYRNPYQTRHTAATLWLAAGENPAWIAKQMGHSNTNMLFTVYARFVPNLTHKDGSAIERLINAQVGTVQMESCPKDKGIPITQNPAEINHLEAEETAFWDQILSPQKAFLGD